LARFDLETAGVEQVEMVLGRIAALDMIAKVAPNGLHDLELLP
jgi:hypothetical protein